MRHSPLPTLVTVFALLLSAPGSRAQDAREIGALRQRAQALYEQASFEEAALIYHRIAALESETDLKISALFTAAWLEHQLGRTESSLQTLTEALVLRPDYVFRRELYNPEFEATYYDAAQDALAVRRRLAQEDTARAIALMEEGRVREARDLFRNVLDLEPNDPKALYNLAMVEIREGNLEEATTALQKVIALDYSSGDEDLVTTDYRARALSRLGMLYHERGYHEDAVQNLAEAVRLDPGTAGNWHVLGLARQQLGDTAGAIEALRRAESLSPADETLSGNLVAVLQQAARWQEVLEATIRGTAEFPGNARLWLSRGQAQRQLGDAAGSIQSLENVMGLDPGNEADLARQAASLLGSQYLARGNHELAASRARQWIEWSPEEVTARSLLGSALQQMGRTREALENHLRAAELDPARGELAYNAGSAHAGLREYRQARASFERALSLKPDLTAAADALGEVRRTLESAVTRLGISLDPTAVVLAIEKRSRGDFAKLRPGDRIVGLQRTRVESTEDLQYLLAERSASGEIALHIVRKGRPKQLTIDVD